MSTSKASAVLKGGLTLLNVQISEGSTTGPGLSNEELANQLALNVSANHGPDVMDHDITAQDLPLSARRTDGVKEIGGAHASSDGDQESSNPQIKHSSSAAGMLFDKGGILPLRST